MYDLVCGESVNEDKIVEEYDYNDDVTIKQMPWMVSLGQFVSPTKWVHNCGGSVITKRFEYILWNYFKT